MANSDTQECLTEYSKPDCKNEFKRDEERAFRWLILTLAIIFYVLMVYHKEFENCKSQMNISRDFIFSVFYFVILTNYSLVFSVLINQNWNQTQPETRREKFRPDAV